jgi:hypothetical protein
MESASSIQGRVELTAGEGEVCGCLGVQRVVVRDPSFERLAELSSVCREHVEGSGDWRGDECGAQLGRAFEAQSWSASGIPHGPPR